MAYNVRMTKADTTPVGYITAQIDSILSLIVSGRYAMAMAMYQDVLTRLARNIINADSSKADMLAIAQEAVNFADSAAKSLKGRNNCG